MTDFPDPVACVRDIADWFRVHAPTNWARLRETAPTSGEEVGALEAELELSLPADFRTYLACSGGGLSFWEYRGLDIRRIAREYRRLCRYLADGTFAGHEIFDDARGFLRRVKWHPGWVPFAEDGCGNHFCLDLMPAESRVSGQVFSWEVRGGPGISTPHPRSFGQFLARYRELLLSNRFSFEVESGTFAGPNVPDARP